MYQGF